MLILRRKNEQWVRIVDTQGHAIRVGVRWCQRQGEVDLMFDDSARHFLIDREERLVQRREGSPGLSVEPIGGCLCPSPIVSPPDVCRYDGPVSPCG